MKKHLAICAFLAIGCLSVVAHAQTEGDGQPESSWVLVSSESVVPQLTPAARDLPAAEMWKPGDPIKEIPRLRTHPGSVGSSAAGGRDPLLDLQLGAPAASTEAFLTPMINISGQGFSGSNPPDTVGDVGPNHYVQAINHVAGSIIQIYDKAGAPIGSPFNLDSLAGGGCGDGYGDPIILYDGLADRWLLSEFPATGDSLCVYVSQTPDPTGAYWSYQFLSASGFPDYPKYSVWPDAYFLGTNESSPIAYALERSQMLLGGPITILAFAAPPLSGFGFQMLTPADVDGATAPPAGSPGYFLRHRDTEAHGAGTCPNPGTSDCLEIYEFTFDFATPANSTFTLAHVIPVAEFDSDLCGLLSFNCIPQPGSGVTLDPLREVTMWRNQYRNFGGYETIVGNLVTDVTGTDQAGVRWFELRRVAPSGWTLYQEGTYAPDADGRWMGSAAMDGEGNIAVGYNVSSSSTYPSLRYAGRLASDPLGTLPQGEGVIVNGSAANASNRYGDYAAMSVDPADDCTFWFTGMFNAASQWSTQIATLKFDSCAAGDFSIDVLPSSGTMCNGDTINASVDLVAIDGFSQTVSLSASGNPAGTTVGFAPPSLTPTGSSTMTISGSATANLYPITVTGTATTATHDAQFDLTILSGPPAAPSLTSPANGATGTSYLPSFAWAASATATGYSIEIAADAGFSNIVETASVAVTGYTATVLLDPSTTYFWRVRAQNLCGAGAMSAAWSFTTAGPTLVCNGPMVDFESGLPFDWTVEDNSPGLDGIVWTTTADPACGIANLTNGSGEAACADSDAPGSVASPAYDTSLVSNQFSTFGLIAMTLDVKAYYLDLDQPLNDTFEVDVHDGSTWSNELTWDENHDPEDFSLDLSAYAGLPSVMVRFRYRGDGWDWYAQADDIQLICTVAPPLFADGFESGDLSAWSAWSP